jgi:DNA-binding transcriptional ArsR family regulator
MVEYKTQLDIVFHSLSDPTRRDILKRITTKELSVNEVAKPYQRQMSLAAVSKHLKVLENARLIEKRRAGKQQFVILSPPAFKEVSKYIEQYRKLWQDRLDRLEKYVIKNK